MSRVAGRWPWFELMVPDVARGVAFYRHVAGWASSTMSMGETPYTMMGPSASSMGCGVTPPQGQGVPPHWAGYVTVPSVDEAVARAEAAGGSVGVPAMDLPTVGRMAMIVDPEGATTWLFTPSDEEGSENYAPGFSWNELQSDDPAKAVVFYVATLGVEPDTVDMGDFTYHLLAGPRGPTCGISAKMMPGAPSMWLAYLIVDDVDAAMVRVGEAGGEVLMQAFDVPGVGRMGVIRDDQGAVVGLHKPSPAEGNAPPEG